MLLCIKDVINMHEHVRTTYNDIRDTYQNPEKYNMQPIDMRCQIWKHFELDICPITWQLLDGRPRVLPVSPDSRVFNEAMDFYDAKMKGFFFEIINSQD
jgi:hypothetical protein